MFLFEKRMNEIVI